MAKNVYNRFFDANKWLEVNKENKNSMEDFLLELKSQRKSEKTIYQYKNDLRIFFIWILDTYDNVPVHKLKKKQLRNFILYLSELGMSANRVNRMKSTCSSFLSYLEDDEDSDVEMNYMSKVKSVQKEMVREIVFLTTEEVTLVYDDLMKNEKYRDALLIAISFESLARRNEIYQLKVEDIDLNKSITRNKVRGKRGKTFNLLYFDKTKEAYSKYMNQRTDNNPDLWVDKNGRSISYESLYDIVVNCREILHKHTGQMKYFNNHSFRHSGAQMYKEGKHYASDKSFSLEELKILMRHSDLSTTSSYLKSMDNEVILSAFGIDDQEVD